MEQIAEECGRFSLTGDLQAPVSGDVLGQLFPKFYLAFGFFLS